MDRRILRLARALRSAGAPVSTAESLDAAAAALAVGVDRRGDLRAALRAVLVKDPDHLADFALLFDREFPAGIPRPDRGAQRRGGGRGAAPGEVGAGPPRGGAAPGSSAGPPRGTPDGPAATRPSPGAIPGEDGEPPEHDGTGEEAGENAEARPAPAPRSPADDGRAAGEDRPAGPSRLTGAQRRRALGKGFRERWDRGDEEAAAAAMEELAERLALRLARRRARARRGALDVRATLRANLRHGGVPFTIARRRRVPGRPDLVLLADVSGSVRRAAALFLGIASRLRGRFSGVRAFAYTDRPVELDAAAVRGGGTGALGALAAALPLDALSDHGEVLRRFNRDFGGAVRGSTLVVVLGDGRNNRAPAQEWELEGLRRRARRVVWIVPERAALWGSGDSAMPRYAPHCDLVLAAPTPAALAAAAAAILPGLLRGIRRRA